MGFRIFLVFWFIVFLRGAPAFGDLQQFAHFGERERSEVNSPHLIGSEYESDRLTYEYLNQWNGIWYQEANAFQYTAGSLGPTRFLTHGRFKFQADVIENLTFKLSYLEVGDYERAREALIFEFSYRLNSLFELSIYGEPDTLKKDDDVGLSWTTHFTQKSFLKLFYTWVDFSFNKRNEDASIYQEKPASWGAEFLHLKSSDGFLQFFFREDQKTRLLFESGRIYQFQGTDFSIKDRSSLGGQRFLSSQLSLRKGHEGDTDFSASPATYFEYQKADLLVQLENLCERIPLFGVRTNYALWESEQGNVIHNNLMPHIWSRPFIFRDGSHIHDIDIGYEMTWHRGRGPGVLRSQLDANDISEHRMNLRYGFSNERSSRFYLLLTFDLDEFGGGETWEGGAMQYSMTF